MNKVLTTLLLVVLMAGCDIDEAVAVNDNLKEERVWVFAQFNVPEEGDKIDSYYYYGKVNDDLYQRISDNKIEHGFIHLQDVKYWGTDDLVHDYSDNEYAGDLIFRIEDIHRLKLIKQEPQTGSVPFPSQETANTEEQLPELPLQEKIKS